MAIYFEDIFNVGGQSGLVFRKPLYLSGTTTGTGANISAGSGAPTFSAPKGSLYTNLTGSSTSTRLYVNTDGATTWTAVTTAA